MPDSPTDSRSTAPNTTPVAGATWPLHVLFTPGARGEALANTIWQTLTSGGWVAAGGLIADGVPPPSRDARYLVLVDGPASAVARSLDAQWDQGVDVEGAIGTWVTVARPLLRLAYQKPGRCMCVDVAEALALGDELWRAITTWEPALAQAPTPPWPKADEHALEVLLSNAALAGNSAQQLFDELQGTCALLRSDAIPSVPAPWVQAITAYGALRHQLARANGDLGQSWRSGDEALQTLALVQQERDALALALAKAEQELDARRQDSGLLLAQTQQLQGDLAASLGKAAESETLLTQLCEKLAEQAEQGAAAARKIGALQDERDAAQRLARTHALALEQAKAAQRETTDELVGLRQKLPTADGLATQTLQAAERERDLARRESQKLLAQLHQMQGELETVYLAGKVHERRLVEESTARALMSGQMTRLHTAVQRQAAMQLNEGHPAPVEVGQVEFGESSLQPPHRQLEVTLREVHVDEQDIAVIQMRLVEHQGHPGLVLLDGPAMGAGLGSFKANAQEDDRDLMLLVPANRPARDAFARMGTRDWRLVNGMLAAIDESLAAPEAVALAFWRNVMRRLRAQIDSLPMRLRYDALDLTTEVPDTLRLDYHRVMSGQRVFGKIALRWAPGSPGSAGSAPVLLLGKPEGAGPPLATWPIDAEGKPQPEWRMPLDSAMAAAERRKLWRSLPASDRDLLLGLLDALPAAATLLAETGKLPKGHDRASLLAAAGCWLPRARGALDPVFMLRRVTRKLRAIVRPAA